MFRFRDLLALSALIVPLDTVAAQGVPYQLEPGDLVFTDTSVSPLRPAAVRVLHPDGSLETILSGAPLNYPDGILIDRDGALLVSNYAYDSSPDNAVLRLDPHTGFVSDFSRGILRDNFTLLRDGGGRVVVADGYAGLARLGPGGDLTHFSPALVGVSFGLALDYDGSMLLSEPPGNATTSGVIYRVGADGKRTRFAEDAHRMPAPNDLALAPDGSLFVTNFHFWTQPNPRLVRVTRDGHAQILAAGGLLKKPKGVAVSALNQVVVADLDDQSILAWTPGTSMRRLISDWDDGVDDGVPVERPFALAWVPPLWLRTPQKMHPGLSSEVSISGIDAWRGQLVLLTASLAMGPTPMRALWPGSLQSSHLNLRNARVFSGLLPHDGSDLHIRAMVPGGVAGLALHLQVLLPGQQVLSNHHAVPLR